MPNHYANAYELAQALYRGHENDFEYWNGKEGEQPEKFRIIKREPLNWVTIERLKTGHTAKSCGNCNLADFQGVAACLIKENVSLLFDKQGNIIKRI